MQSGASCALVEAYLQQLHDIHGTRHRTPELAYRAPLENLLNAIGSTLDPPAHAAGELSDSGSGRPDFGIYEVRSGSLRAVVEVKAVESEVTEIARGEQITGYCQRYGLVLITNYRDYLLVGRSKGNGVSHQGRCTLADDAEAFWRSRPGPLSKRTGDDLVDFLIGVMRRAAPITRAGDLADDLARHAREAKRRLERHDIAAVEPLKGAMEQALGLHFTGREGETFFRSSLVQTLFYGLFSGWMLWRQGKHKAGTFDWKDATDHLALPLIGDLYEEIARPRRLADLNLREPLEWATESLNHVVEEEFFKAFDEEHAITLFYEPFLEAFDPALRKELGVWYTPPEIVRYMVGRVDQLLRDELGIADGFADEQVYVLDPAAGTGSYLVEVAKTIHGTLTQQGHGALAAARVKTALCHRVFGFEILPAPYVVAHLQLGVFLRGLGIALGPDERAGVYLTNALTGWEPPKGAKQTLAFHFLEEEQEAARKVKRDAPILVILGNPPYNRFAGVAEEEEADLIEPYKKDLYEEWGVRKQLLDDLYIRFFRLAEKRIAEAGGRGVVCYISNYSWLDGLSHPVMREHLATSFDAVWIDNCNGDKYRTGKRTPDGLPDESMFTTDEHRIGIQVGTAVASFVKRGPSKGVARVFYRDFWGTGNVKRTQLLKSLAPRPRDVPRYEPVAPRATMRWVFVNSDLGQPTVFETWPKLVDLLPVHYSGLNENRLSAFLAIDRNDIERRMKAYFDERLTLEELGERIPGVGSRAAGYDPVQTRKSLLTNSEYQSDRVIPVVYRPFDQWWTYWEGRFKFVNRPRPDFFRQVWPGNVFISASQTARKGGFNQPVIVNKFGDLHLQDPWSQFFPLWVRVTEELGGERTEPNVNHKILEATCLACHVKPYEKDGRTWSKRALHLVECIFYHTLAVLWSPAYRRENEAALRQDWPRVPIPADAKLLEASAGIGRVVGDLLLADVPVRGVTTGKLREELRHLGVPTKVGGTPIEEPADTRVEAGWGFRGQKNAVMCGKGSVVPCDNDPKNAVNVFINERVYWANVPTDVWTMTIGGYPVVKKWLSYREYKVLGRALRMEELTYVTDVVRRLNALRLLGEDLDANYQAAARAAQVTENDGRSQGLGTR